MELHNRRQLVFFSYCCVRQIIRGLNGQKPLLREPETGALLWNYTTGAGVWGSPTVADGKVYVGSQDRKFYCLNAATGGFIWSYTTGGTLWSSPVVANGVAYAVSSDSKVYAFSPWDPIPEGLTIGVMLLLSTVAVIVSARYYRKRPKWQRW
jgi:PQQ-like domain